MVSVATEESAATDSLSTSLGASSSRREASRSLLPIIIGGVAGGILLLTLIVVGTIVVARRRRLRRTRTAKAAKSRGTAMPPLTAVVVDSGRAPTISSQYGPAPLPASHVCLLLHIVPRALLQISLMRLLLFWQGSSLLNNERSLSTSQYSSLRSGSGSGRGVHGDIPQLRSQICAITPINQVCVCVCVANMSVCILF